MRKDISKYIFKSDEKQFVMQRLAQVDALLAEMRGLFAFIHSREKLDGTWDLSPDRSGLMKVDAEQKNG